MSDYDFRSKKCLPCEGGVAPLTPEQVEKYMGEIPEWDVTDDVSKIMRTYELPRFRDSISFVNKIADLAEEQDHHPDLSIHFRKVGVELSTHAIGGLSENDFIIAARIDDLFNNSKDVARP